MRRFILTVAALALVVAAPAAARAQDGFRVIVNAANPATSISKAELSRIYLKKRSAWDNGRPVVVVDQTERSTTRARFSVGVLGKDVPTMKAYWQASLFGGRGGAPIEQADDSKVAAYVAANDGAIGYISASAPLPAGVKVIEIGG